MRTGDGMDPMVFHPNGGDEKREEKEPTKISVMDHSEIDQTAEARNEEPFPSQPGLPVFGESENTIMPPSAKKSKKGLWITLALLLIAAAGVGAWQLIGKKDKQPTVTQNTVKSIENLRVGSDFPPFDSFYPNVNFLTGSSYAVNFQVYEGLVGFKDANTVVPLLAESWTNPDDTTWVFKLKEGVKFQNGKPVTATDVSHSIDVAKGSEIPPLIYDTIDSVRVIDNRQIEIKTTSADPILLNKLAFLMIVGDDNIGGALVGTGPFRVDESVAPSETGLTLLSFDDYHGGKPSVRKITYIGYESADAMLAAMEKGEIDITDAFVDQTKNITPPAGYRRIDLPAGDVNIIVLNSETPSSPLAKKDVRQALLLSVDVEKLMTNRNIKGRQLSQFTLSSNVGFNPDLQPVKRDVAKAKELLKNAGYPNGLTLRYIRRPDKTADQVIFDTFKVSFAEAGITLKEESSKDIDDFYAKIDGGQTQLSQYYVTSALIDSYDIFAYNFKTKNYSNPAFDKLLDESNATLDLVKRKQILQNASKLLVDDVAAIPLYNPDNFFYINESINFTQSDIPGLINPGYLFKLSAN